MQNLSLPLKTRSFLEWGCLVLQCALIICTCVVLFTRPHLVQAIRNEEISSNWLLVGPFVFLLFFLLLLALEFLSKNKFFLTVFDTIKISFGILVILLLFPSSLREYRARRIPDPMSVSLIEQFSKNKDAGVRALAILASARHKINDPALGALIHKALLDKDPLVQQAAKLVIEDNFGIRLKNGAEGIDQAQALLTDVGSKATLMRKGSP